MPAQLGNALTQMMQLKQMRAQNKLAEYQMEQAKAAQAQQQAQQVALQKVFTEYGDPNIAEIGQYNPQVGFALIEIKKNLNQVDPTVIENNIKMSSMIDQAASGGVATYSTLQQLVPQLRGKPYDSQLVAQIAQRNKPYLAAWQDIQTSKDKPKYTLMNDDGSTQVVEATTIADKNKYDVMVKTGTAREGEYKKADKPSDYMARAEAWLARPENKGKGFLDYDAALATATRAPEKPAKPTDQETAIQTAMTELKLTRTEATKWYKELGNKIITEGQMDLDRAMKVTTLLARRAQAEKNGADERVLTAMDSELEALGILPEVVKQKGLLQKAWDFVFGSTEQGTGDSVDDFIKDNM